MSFTDMCGGTHGRTVLPTHSSYSNGRTLKVRQTCVTPTDAAIGM